ncbi:MAG: hypothetical protein ACOKSU_23970 [Pseudomonas sp.]|uniref:hypothetical protein n=1 Tax=Pseudomonas TaxID=286 RepID=UPI0003C06A18|nr:hypothetical protein [Pseudomonas sp. VLB120]AGZ36595.1 hypothetical protein PVLB_19070 [Pseudomonas sp. VLB120]
MSKAEELAKAMQAKQTQAVDQEQQVKTFIARWITDVQELFLDIERWIDPLVKAGLKVTRQMMHKSESPLDKPVSYSIERIQLQFNGKTITLDPSARFILGGKGRIDIRADRQELLLIHSATDELEDQWGIWTKPERGAVRPDVIPFDEDYMLGLIQKTFNL